MIEIYTDGACAVKSKIGGIGVYIPSTGERLSEGFKDTTNNRMELTAILKALQAIKEPSDIVIYSDSKYCIDGASSWVKSWVKSDWITSSGTVVKNKTLWEKLIELKKFHKRVIFKWVKAHNGHEYNEIVDKLATDAILEIKGKEK